MAEDKKSFVLYCDLLHTVRKLSDEQAGKLFKHILEYVNDNEPTTDDALIDIVFEPIRQSLKRDLQKYLNRVEKNRLNGAKGGRPKKPTETEKTHSVILKPKKADSDTDSDSDSDNVSDNDIDYYSPKVFGEDVLSCYYKCLNYFDDELHPKSDEAKDKWITVIRQLNEIDKLSFNDIEHLVKLTRSDKFWSKNFLSILKLRKKDKAGVPYWMVFYQQFKQKQNNFSYESIETIRNKYPNC